MDGILPAAIYESILHVGNGKEDLLLENEIENIWKKYNAVNSKISEFKNDEDISLEDSLESIEIAWRDLKVSFINTIKKYEVISRQTINK